MAEVTMKTKWDGMLGPGSTQLLQVACIQDQEEALFLWTYDKGCLQYCVIEYCHCQSSNPSQ